MIVVADTSVLLNLCRIGQVELLARLFREVVIPRKSPLSLAGWLDRRRAFEV